MDYSGIFEDFLYSQLKGAYTSITVSQLSDSTYQAEIHYVDEEIENYLGRGWDLTLLINVTNIDEIDNSIGFTLSLVKFSAPDFSTTDAQGIYMKAYIYQEVANVAYKCLHHIEFDYEYWVALD